jgi:hypothetical protein
MSNIIKQSIQYELQYLSSREKEMLDTLMKDFCGNFAYCGESLFGVSFRRKEYQSLLKAMESDDDALNYLVVSGRIVNYESYLSKSYNVRENSTSALHREASIFKYKEIIDMVGFLKSVILSYTDTL